jgi:hypothetical protein
LDGLISIKDSRCATPAAQDGCQRLNSIDRLCMHQGRALRPAFEPLKSVSELLPRG